jgi:hypothetical protein
LNPGYGLAAVLWAFDPVDLSSELVKGVIMPNGVNYTTASGESRRAAIPIGLHEVAYGAIVASNHTELSDSWPDFVDSEHGH